MAIIQSKISLAHSEIHKARLNHYSFWAYSLDRVELCFQDQARFEQQNTTTHV